MRGVALTGSERAGSAVAAQAGKALKKTTLELGGSDPFIVLDDANLDEVIPNAVAGRMSNNGQVCTAAKRMIVHESLADEFVRRLSDALAEFRYGDPLEQGVTHGPMSSENAMKLALSQVEKAVSHGATLVTGGKQLDRDGFFMQAGLLTGVKKDNPIFYEEIFGPVAIVYPVADEDAAVAWQMTRLSVWAVQFTPAMSSVGASWPNASKPAWSISTNRPAPHPNCLSAASRTPAMVANSPRTGSRNSSITS